MKTKKKFFYIIIAVPVVLSVLVFGGIGVIAGIGNSRLKSRMDRQPAAQIRYQNEIYEYNDDIMTFLIMGIDQGRDLIDIETYEIDDEGGGQSDALFLAVLNPRDKSIRIIAINRNTMTDIDVYADDGTCLQTVRAQINLQHGFGDGREQSCEYQLKAVEHLFYDIPIHGYAAVNLSAIMALNDTVGGVDVTVLDDITLRDPSLVKGSQVHLMGESAFWYVKYRNTDIFASADMRLARQKQYLTAFLDVARDAVKKNPRTALDLYKALEPHMVTDISLIEAARLLSLYSQYTFDENSFYTLEGETVLGEKFEEFYVDENALYEMILTIFYEKKES
ncbi:MAG: LCP family protein [Roseburia sp.]|nr:LCP family protein [Ruminococcus sp.]MCM1156692.1 LCP family protein [Roseburia sp.]MCM1243874.1 LCP family protein [Roseburia sp.]